MPAPSKAKAVASSDAVAMLIYAGFAVCKPTADGKAPKYKDWSTRSVVPDDFRDDDNVGIMSGPLSNGGKSGNALVIIDLDADDAVRLADEFLPATAMMEGRKSKPKSHRYYLVPHSTIPEWGTSSADASAPVCAAMMGHAGPFKKAFNNRDTDNRVIDFLGTGSQAVCPPSGHHTGERREWNDGVMGEPAIVFFEDLWRSVCELASACDCKIPDVVPRPLGWVARTTASVEISVIERAKKYLATMPVAVSGENGHNKTFAAARAMVWGFDLGVDIGLDLLKSDYNPRCVPKWSDKDLVHKCDDADRIPFGKPRGYIRDAERKPVSSGVAGGFGDGKTTTPSKPEPWEDPIPLSDPADKPPAFPLCVMPPSLAALCADIGDTIGCPPDYAACFALGAMAGTIGATTVLNVKQDWEEHASLFICAVAPPNAGKTPSFKLITRPLVEQQKERYKDRTEGKKINPVFVSDVTVEKLADILQDDSRGQIVLRDELSGWVKGMDQYKSRGGSDRQFWLSAWSSDPITVHRKGPDSPDVFISHPCISVVGGIQPSVLHDLQGQDDGFFDRILFTFPEPHNMKGEDWKSCNPVGMREWEKALGRVRLMEMIATEPDKPRCPHFRKLDAIGRDEWYTYTHALAKQMNVPEFPHYLAGVAGKLKGYAARLALVSMVLRIAYTPDGEIEDINGDDMAAGATLANYFLAHAERVYRRMGRDDSREPRKVLAWMVRNGKDKVSRRDIHHNLKRSFPDVEDLGRPLRMLTERGYIRVVESEGVKPGRKPTTIYEIHPGALSGSLSEF